MRATYLGHQPTELGKRSVPIVKAAGDLVKMRRQLPNLKGLAEAQSQSMSH